MKERRMRPHGRIRRSAKVCSSWRGASDRRSRCLICAARIALDSKAGLLRTSASMKQSHSASGAEWLCFIDADVRSKPALLSSAMRAAQIKHLDLLSLAPRQELHTFAERLILPCGLILLSFIQDLRQAQARSGGGVTATGQFMLVRRDAYEAVGGHA